MAESEGSHDSAIMKIMLSWGQWQHRVKPQQEERRVYTDMAVPRGATDGHYGVSEQGRN